MAPARSISKSSSSAPATSKSSFSPTSTATVLYLGERECSVQRRHQKVIEEAPSAVVGPDLRRRMGEAAAALRAQPATSTRARSNSCSTTSRTSTSSKMNTRLQVEHAVTELVTGLDLVHLQIAIAEGKPLPFTQDEITLRGHAHRSARLRRRSRRPAFFPRPETSPASCVPAAPAFAKTTASTKAGKSPPNTTPCSPSSSPSRPTAPPPSRASLRPRRVRHRRHPHQPEAAAPHPR